MAELLAVLGALAALLLPLLVARVLLARRDRPARRTRPRGKMPGTPPPDDPC